MYFSAWPPIWTHTFLHFSEFFSSFFKQKSYSLVDCVECKALANIYLNQTRKKNFISVFHFFMIFLTPWYPFFCPPVDHFLIFQPIWLIFFLFCRSRREEHFEEEDCGVWPKIFKNVKKLHFSEFFKYKFIHNSEIIFQQDLLCSWVKVANILQKISIVGRFFLILQRSYPENSKN